MFVISFSRAQVLINEYSAANFDSYLDNYNEYEDWIELYNSSSNSVDLNGWYLSDRASNPMKWNFTSSFIIPANGVAVIFCSSRDEIIGNNAHTNFKLTQTKNNEKIILSDPTGTIVDSVDLVPNLTSHSRGRETNGSINWSVFTTPTPSANNFNAQLEYSEKPSFSQAAGYYTGSVNVSITTNDPNATIYYTTNGDQPTINSSVYSSPITLTTTSVLKAISVSSLANVPASFTTSPSIVNSMFESLTITTGLINCSETFLSIFFLASSIVRLITFTFPMYGSSISPSLDTVYPFKYRLAAVVFGLLLLVLFSRLKLLFISSLFT